MVRLTKKDIEGFFARKFKIYKSGEVILRIQKNNLKIIRSAFIISSAVKRNAVTRNKTRRRMNEILKSILSQTNPGYDLVFSHKLQNKKAPPFSELKNDIIKLLTLCGAL